jgi:hypothetical protein
MTACEYQYATYVDHESIPAFLAYLGSYYQNANTKASCRINVLADRWPQSLIEQLSLHEKLNLVISDNSALQYTQRSKIDLLIDYLRWLDSIQHARNLSIISHYNQGLFLKPFNISKGHHEFDVLVAGPSNSRFEQTLGLLLITS